MNVYNRKLFFNRGGRVSARGTGITSGLIDTPKRGYVDGPGSYAGEITGTGSLLNYSANDPSVIAGQEMTDNRKFETGRLNTLFKEKQRLLQSIRPDTPKFNRLDAATPALLTFFGNLMSGKSYQGGIGGALDIAGQSLTAATPQFSEALTARRKAKADERSEQFQLDLQAYGSAEDALAAEKLAEATAAGKAPVFKHKGTFDEIYTYPTDKNHPEYVEGKEGLKVKRITAINAREGTTGTEYGDEVILSEEPWQDNTPPTSTAKNILFKTGSKANTTSGAVVFNDGTAFYYDPDNENADERGLINVEEYDGDFEFYTSQTQDKRDDLFTDRDISDLAGQISQFSQTLASGGDLLSQGKNLGTNLNSLNRYILDTGGQLLGQISPSAKQALFNWFEENPDDLTRFILDARTYAAQMIAPFTGEESSRISEPERELTNQTVRLFDGIIDAPTALAAIEASISLTYLGQHRNFLTLDEDYQYSVDNQEENYNGWGLSGAAQKHHTEKMRNLGMSDEVIRSTILKMQLMEQSGLADLRIITSGFNNRTNDSILRTQNTLLGN